MSRDGDTDPGPAAAQRVDRALAALDELAPQVREAALEAVRALVELYGHALHRILTRLHEADAPVRPADLARDELVGQLLLLHDLHPDGCRDPAQVPGAPGGPGLVRLGQRTQTGPTAPLPPSEVEAVLMRIRATRAAGQELSPEDGSVPDADPFFPRGLISPVVPLLSPAAADSRSPGVEALRCELCGEPIAERHRHLLDRREMRLRCACQACSLLLGERGDERYRAVPESLSPIDDLPAPPRRRPAEPLQPARTAKAEKE